MKNVNSNKTLIHCDNCSAELYLYRYQINRSARHYCSKSCEMEYKKENGLHSGVNNPNYKGEDTSFTCTYCGKLSEKKCPANLKNSVNHFCSIECQAKWKSENLTGNNAFNWRGGNGTLLNNVRKLTASSDWTKSILLRDEFKCQSCGRGSNKLNVHHLAPFRSIVRRNNITSSTEAQLCDELWNLDNGVTMCKTCHRQFHNTYGIYKFTPEDFLKFKEMKEEPICH